MFSCIWSLYFTVHMCSNIPCSPAYEVFISQLTCAVIFHVLLHMESLFHSWHVHYFYTIVLKKTGRTAMHVAAVFLIVYAMYKVEQSKWQLWKKLMQVWFHGWRDTGPISSCKMSVMQMTEVNCAKPSFWLQNRSIVLNLVSFERAWAGLHDHM